MVRIGFDYFEIEQFDFNILLQILGNVGLILIVLEGSLDLSVSRKKLGFIANAFLNALLIFASTTAAISFVLIYFYEISFYTSLIYSIPLSTVSSAIAIPSASSLQKDKRDFIVFETTFSDIIGIMVFSFCFLESTDALGLFGEISLSIVLTIALAFVFSFFLVYIVAKSKIKVKFFLVLALLILLYAVGKKFHLPSLFIVLVFGLLLKNHQLFGGLKSFKFLKDSRIDEAVHEIEYFTVELAFVIRTFFFLLFGYSINLEYFLLTEVWVTGSVILLCILIFRFINMKLVYREKSIFPEIFIAPRGLITVLLFYSIPVQYITDKINPGIMYFVIMASNIIMMLAIIFSGKSVMYANGKELLVDDVKK